MEEKELSVQEENKSSSHDNQDRGEKKLMRSGNKMLLGVCGGLGYGR